MKKSLALFFVLIIAALSVLSVSAAPRDRYYDQLGNKHWCNSDSYGCWITGENGEHEYIMFWSESARDSIMGPGSKAPIGTNPGTSELPLLPPTPVAAASDSGGDDTRQCSWTEATCNAECDEWMETACKPNGYSSCVAKLEWWEGTSSTPYCTCTTDCQ